MPRNLSTYARIQGMPRSPRRMRRPQHPFQLRTRPWVIQPFMIAPVLAGETLRSLLLQSRAVTDPVRSPIVGWWKEYYFFYCKLSQIQSASEEFTLMLLDPDKSMSSFVASAVDWVNYTPDDGIKYVEYCRDLIVRKWFRDEGAGETHTTAGGLIANASPAGNVPVAWIGRDDFTQSLMQRDQYDRTDSSFNLFDMASLFTATVDTSDAGQAQDPVTFTSAKMSMSGFEDAYRAWMLAREQNLVQMTFDDYLRAQGVNVPSPLEADRPELLRYVRTWQYPSNTIDPQDGSPVSAVSWVVQERADKDRFFSEPGFIVGVTCARPKIYKRLLKGNATAMMNEAKLWLPESLRTDRDSSFVQCAADGGPLPAAGELYVFDTRDIFTYGDQFVNFDPASVTDGSFVDLPGAAGGVSFANRYPDIDDVKAVFVDATNDVLTRVREDGLVALNVAGRVEELSP